MPGNIKCRASVPAFKNFGRVGSACQPSTLDTRAMARVEALLIRAFSLNDYIMSVEENEFKSSGDVRNIPHSHTAPALISTRRF